MVQIYTKLKELSVDSILDMATGQGQFLQEICESFKNYNRALGVDNSFKAIKAASEKEMDKKISFMEMDCENLDLKDESFDVVCICNSLHHFQNVEKVLKEALRVLKKGGYLIISEMFHSSHERKSQSTHSEFHHWWGEIDSASGNYHGRTFTRETLESLICSLPLTSLEVEMFEGDDNDIYNEDVIKQLTSACNVYREKAENLEYAETLCDKADVLLEKLHRDGFSPASRLEFLCRK